MSEPKPMPTYWSLAEEVTHLHGQLDQLEAENAKLRELVYALFRCAYGTLRDLAPSCYDSGADGCGLDCIDNGERCCMAVMERRVRELGIEVD